LVALSDRHGDRHADRLRRIATSMPRDDAHVLLGPTVRLKRERLRTPNDIEATQLLDL
jgi:hypothetical protein